MEEGKKTEKPDEWNESTEGNVFSGRRKCRWRVRFLKAEK